MRTHLHRDTLLAVDRLAGDSVLGQKSILLATGNENTLVTVRLDDDLGTALHATTACRYRVKTHPPKNREKL